MTARLPRLPRWGTMSRLNWRVMLVQVASNAVVIGVLIALCRASSCTRVTGCSPSCGSPSRLAPGAHSVRPPLEFLFLPYLLQSRGLVVIVISAALLALL